MEKSALDPNDYQGGKKFGQLIAAKQEALNDINREFLEDDNLKEIEDLPEKLEAYKHKFVDFDADMDDVIGFRDLQLMMEKLGQAKTHLELKKMITEVDKTGTGTINYRDFIDMMLGTKNSVLKLIIMFEEMAKTKENKNKAPPPKKNIADLP